MAFTDSFTARTRRRGEVTYHRARWTEKPHLEGGYEVEFLEGPHQGEKFTAIQVDKAKDYKYLPRRKNDPGRDY